MAHSAGAGPRSQQQKQCRCLTFARAAQQDVFIGACIALVEVVVRCALISHSVCEQASCQCPANLVQLVPAGHPIQAQAPAQQQNKELELCNISPPALRDSWQTAAWQATQQSHNKLLAITARRSLHVQRCCSRR